jgi:hypothetical protein
MAFKLIKSWLQAGEHYGVPSGVWLELRMA